MMIVAVTALFLSVFLLVWLAGTRSMSLGKIWIDLLDRASMRPFLVMFDSDYQGERWEGTPPSDDVHTDPVGAAFPADD